jgi:hypothetical protein
VLRQVRFIYVLKAQFLAATKEPWSFALAIVMSPKLGDLLDRSFEYIVALAPCYQVEQQDAAFLLMQNLIRAFGYDSRRFEDHSGSVAYRQARRRSNLSEYSQSMYTPQTK